MTHAPFHTKNPSQTLGYAVKVQEVQIGEHGYTIRSLLDRAAVRRPRRSTRLPAGSRRPPGPTLASSGRRAWCWLTHMDMHVLEGQRVLEVGCGLALPGLVLHRRGADVVVSDRHPECASFLLEKPHAQRHEPAAVLRRGLGRAPTPTWGPSTCSSPATCSTSAITLACWSSSSSSTRVRRSRSSSSTPAGGRPVSSPGACETVGSRARARERPRPQGTASMHYHRG